MQINIKLEDDVDVKFYKHRDALLVATIMFNAYNVTKEDLIGVGPELFAEQWMYSYLRSPDERFEDLTLIYFVKILTNILKLEQ